MSNPTVKIEGFAAVILVLLAGLMWFLIMTIAFSPFIFLAWVISKVFA